MQVFPIFYLHFFVANYSVMFAGHVSGLWYAILPQFLHNPGINPGILLDYDTMLIDKLSYFRYSKAPIHSSHRTLYTSPILFLMDRPVVWGTGLCLLRIDKGSWCVLRVSYMQFWYRCCHLFDKICFRYDRQRLVYENLNSDWDIDV